MKSIIAIKKGFTLIEIMVVISLSAILGWLSYSGFSSLQNRFLDYQRKEQRFKTIQNIVQTIEKDIQNIKKQVLNPAVNGNLENIQIFCQELQTQTNCTIQTKKLSENSNNIKYIIQHNQQGLTQELSINNTKIWIDVVKNPMNIKFNVNNWQQKQVLVLQIYQKNTSFVVPPFERKWVF